LNFIKIILSPIQQSIQILNLAALSNESAQQLQVKKHGLGASIFKLGSSYFKFHAYLTSYLDLSEVLAMNPFGDHKLTMRIVAISTLQAF